MEQERHVSLDFSGQEMQIALGLRAVQNFRNHYLDSEENRLTANRSGALTWGHRLGN